MKAIAIDDEPMALEVIKSHAAKIPFLELKKTFNDALEALEYLQKEKIDLIFLDIKMPDISGIDFFKSLSIKPMVIFTTAYSEHAVTSFELDAIDYLLKPFSLGRFIKSCNKTHELFTLRKKEIVTDHIFVKDGYNQIKIEFDEILYLEASGNYVTFYLETGKTLSRFTFNEVLNLLPEEKFIRIHRSFAVSLKKVIKIERHQVLIKSTSLPVSKAYKENLFDKLNI
ncbi:LytTR family DNA-binding domain-containing protein [Christiangramia sp. SM2212]|uniref:LytTR family DNA-binding domain-containing protein n=1 Tax=Christiangramia sediminicola TaxID=3073267 RepID=A0ABU1EN04_9FLAO|nr:LytTR family DNA-binding domain-containing protein [Christiangramia sp. SM2212]MDR5589603.1 LytTR family DNA-binding domain-containing protein [Christiangramia sp. SM2212]